MPPLEKDRLDAAALRPAEGDELLVYRWKIEGIKGLILRLVAPSRGEGSLTTVLSADGHFETELHMSAESRRRVPMASRIPRMNSR